MTTCSAIGLSSDTLVGSTSNSDASDANVSGTVKTNEGLVKSGTGQEVDLAITGASIVDAVVVKGANGYNSYRNPNDLPPSLEPDQHYIPPFNNGGNMPTISHWFACYHIEPAAVTPEVPLVLALPLAGGAVFATWMLANRRRHHESPAYVDR